MTEENEIIIRNEWNTELPITNEQINDMRLINIPNPKYYEIIESFYQDFLEDILGNSAKSLKVDVNHDNR